ncbi:MAG: hypothetical protein FWC50_07595 [Planctomycetaceae bacterium]|nr:hypothetical protein [Planctomycetaceae bacterium]
MVDDALCYKIIEDSLKVCSRYQPKFGVGRNKGLSYEQFHEIYSSDVFYSWFGLSSSRIYAAHKAAGGLTSIYRQIGMATEKIFRLVLKEQLAVTEEDCTWKYSPPNSKRVLKLDGRIELEQLKTTERRRKTLVKQWLEKATGKINLQNRGIPFRGVVFECRQGYKSKDAKRQNADLDNATSIIGHNYLPCIALFSQQMDSDITERYMQHHWLLLKGTLDGTPLDSIYVFMREVLEYDLADFFERNQSRIIRLMDSILEKILRTE